jgi:hypothetical protein
MKSFIRRLAFLIVATLGLALHAEEATVPMTTTEPENFSLSLGGFFLTNIHTTVSLSSSNGSAGSDVDFNEQLGESTSATVFRVDFEWRIAQHHKIEATWFNISQSSTHVLDRTINWGDQVYPISATINTSVKYDIYKVDYGYVFYSSPSNEFSGLIGAHITTFDFGLSLANGGSAQHFKATAPLPVIGLEWKGHFSEKWSAKVAYEYFGVSIDDKYSGHLSDFVATTEYRLTEHWGLGAGYNRFDITAKAKGDRAELKFKRNYNGLLLFVAAHF